MDIASLLGNLSEEDMGKLRKTAEAFFGGGEEARPAQEKNALSALPGFSPEMLTQAAKLSAALSRQDPRSDFILALKPLLSVPRQKKCDEAAMMVRLFGLLGAGKEGL